MSATVAVLMSTYNGENYIREQIDSILHQTEVEVKLIIRDDGSRDHTPQILKEYEQDPRVKIVLGENCGVGNSFMRLLYKSPEADYYAFADQDDVWLEEKLISAIRLMSAYREGAVLYASNQTITDADLNVIQNRYRTLPRYDIANTIMGNCLAGCTFVMNRELRNRLIKKECRPSEQFLKVRIHDAWVCAFANCAGHVVYDENSFILYRQHEKNVVGAEATPLWKAAVHLLHVSKDKNAVHYRQYMAKELQKCTRDIQVEEPVQNVLNAFSELDNIRGRIRFCNNNEVFRFLKNKNVIRIKAICGLL